MLTAEKSYQIVIALLKEYGIRHCVLSAGSRNVPFVHSVEEDEYFSCYSVVDERSAGYFALGLAQELGEPVVISCTSSTATCNYWPAVAEAYYQHVPLVVLTSDRNPAMLGQLEDQMIDQVSMYDRHVRKSVNLPLITDEGSWLYCQRLVNEALLELDHRKSGPVHINVPSKAYSNSFSEGILPMVNRIHRFNAADDLNAWKELAARLREYRRIMVVCGQRNGKNKRLEEAQHHFFEQYNCFFAAEYMGNVEHEGVVNVSLCMDCHAISQKKFEEYQPDLIISYGGNVTFGLKELLRQNCRKADHWLIDEDGLVCDAFGCLKVIVECTPEVFFERVSKVDEQEKSSSSKEYFYAVREFARSSVFPDLGFSNLIAIKKTVESIPSGSNLHLAINSAIRITNYSVLQPNISVYANIGTHGIDGCLSSFLGQACASPEKMNYLVIGDLAFFYDMNALRIRHLGNNVRILLLNNHGGEEFYFNGMWQNEASDLHTTARHDAKAKSWAESCGLRYLTAEDDKTLDEALDLFFANDCGPVLLEVFTEMKEDSHAVHALLEANYPKSIKRQAIREGKRMAKEILGESGIEKVKKMLA